MSGLSAALDRHWYVCCECNHIRKRLTGPRVDTCPECRYLHKQMSEYGMHGMHGNTGAQAWRLDCLEHDARPVMDEAAYYCHEPSKGRRGHSYSRRRVTEAYRQQEFG